MPIREVKEGDISLKYYLICFDKDGWEREEEGGFLSKQILDILSKEPITDVFLMSHGWLGDIPAAIRQYDRWTTAMAKNQADIQKMKELRPGFYPLLIGLHWPSKPWGEENLNISFDVTQGDGWEDLVNEYAENIADTETAKEAIRTILAAAVEDIAPESLPPEVVSAYNTLNQEASLETKGEGAAPGSDRPEFDPEDIYQASKDDEVNYAGFSLEGILGPLRTLSFWKMKDRARKFGESGGFNLLTELQKATTESVKFHLMGHSFGCIVMSSILGGPNGQGTLFRPVNSVALIQGALSLWSYCESIPHVSGVAGYFRSVIADKKVNGPIITTQSIHDTAVGKMYPLGAGVARQVSFDALEQAFPKYGALGTWGARGPGIEIVDLSMFTVDKPYNFQPGIVYNLNCDQFICDKTGGGLGGAHSDIAKPEVAHAVWSAAFSN